jgi:hypothetical protein
MPEEPVRLRPIEEADLDALRRFDVDPSARGPYLSSVTDVANIAEQRALERIGFRREGVMRGLAFDGGRWHDGVLYARLRGDPV